MRVYLFLALAILILSIICGGLSQLFGWTSGWSSLVVALGAAILLAFLTAVALHHLPGPQ